MYKKFLVKCKRVWQQLQRLAVSKEATMSNNTQRPEWLDEFENLANEQLETGSSCHQVHPIIEQWYASLAEPPPSRDSILQAMSCLSTELLTDMPDDIFEALFDNDLDYEAVVAWVQDILMIGRAFQDALTNGGLDDL